MMYLQKRPLYAALLLLPNPVSQIYLKNLLTPVRRMSAEPTRISDDGSGMGVVYVSGLKILLFMEPLAGASSGSAVPYEEL